MVHSAKLGMTVRLIVVVVSAIALGLLGARIVLVGSWLSLIPWGIACLVIGLATRTWRATLILGAVFGVTVVFAFEIFGYQSTAPLARAVPLFALISVVGGVAAAAGAAAGHALRMLTSRFRH
jgi:hypothetical protein